MTTTIIEQPQPAWVLAFRAAHPINISGITCTCEPVNGAFEIRDRDCGAHA